METKISKPRRTIEEMFALIETGRVRDSHNRLSASRMALHITFFITGIKNLKGGLMRIRAFFEEIKTTRNFSADLEIIFPSGAKILLPATCDAAFIKSLVM